MSNSLRAIAALIAILVGACASDPSQSFPVATAQASCGPADGPAVMIDLGLTAQAPPALPYIRLFVYRSITDVGGKSWSLNPPHQDGIASYCPSTGDCVTATDGSIRFDPGASELRGTVNLVFPVVGRIRGGFRATIKEVQILCG